MIDFVTGVSSELVSGIPRLHSYGPSTVRFDSEGFALTYSFYMRPLSIDLSAIC